MGYIRRGRGGAGRAHGPVQQDGHDGAHSKSDEPREAERDKLMMLQ